MPICNATLLDWTFESLALAGIVEIFVIVRSHTELVKNTIRCGLSSQKGTVVRLHLSVRLILYYVILLYYYSDSRWSQPSSGLKIVPIVTAQDTFSAGDAMRDVYTHGVITGDFVLVHGDLVSNVRIDEVVRAHKARRKVNKNMIMTMVVKEAGAGHRTKCVIFSPFFLPPFLPVKLECVVP